MLVAITPSNASNFSSLAPKQELVRIGRDIDCFGIGYTEDVNSLPDGVLIFKLIEEFGDDEKEHPIAQLRYFYVKEEARDMYVGAFLFSQLLTILADSHTEAIRCDVPLGSEYNLLCNVLQDFGFHFQMTEIFEYEFLLSEFLTLAENRGAPAQPLSVVPKVLFADKMKALKEKKYLQRYELYPYASDYDQDISTALYEDGRLKGLFLVDDDMDGTLCPMLLRIEKGASPAGVLRLLSTSLEKAHEKYSLNTHVRIWVHNDRSWKLLKHFFPNATPRIVRRGYFYI